MNGEHRLGPEYDQWCRAAIARGEAFYAEWGPQDD